MTDTPTSKTLAEWRDDAATGNGLNHVRASILFDHIAALEARCKAAEEERDSYQVELETVMDKDGNAGAVANYFDLGREFGVNIDEYESVYEGVTEWKKQAEACADTLAAENEALRAALKPLADVAGDIPDSWPNDHQCVTECGHFRRAAQALGDRT